MFRLSAVAAFQNMRQFFDSITTCWKTRPTYQPKAKIHYCFSGFMVLLSRRHIYFFENAAFQPAKRAFAKKYGTGQAFQNTSPVPFSVYDATPMFDR